MIVKVVKTCQSQAKNTKGSPCLFKKKQDRTPKVHSSHYKQHL